MSSTEAFERKLQNFQDSQEPKLMHLEKLFQVDEQTKVHDIQEAAH